MSCRRNVATRIAACLAVTALVACGDLSGTEKVSSEAISLTPPTGTDTGKGTGPDTGTASPDTTTHPDTSAGPDTTAVPGDTLPDAIITGTMIGIDSTTTPFVELGAIPGVRITAFRWLGVDSSAGAVRTLRDSVAFTVSAGDGTFGFEGLRSGIYILRAVPPNGSGYLPAEIGTRAHSIRSLPVVLSVPLKFYLHKQR
jgi:hypothetical protein